MNEQQLRSFVGAAHQGSFSRAAANAFLTTSALVQQVNQLESDLHRKLFLRGPGGVTLTDEGRDFLGTAEEILRMMDASRAGSALLDKSFELKVGVEHSEVADYLLAICELCKTAHPMLRFSFFSTNTADQPQALAQGKSDLFVAPDYLPLLEGQTLHPFYLDGYRCCVPAGHRLTRLDYVHPSDLTGERVYMEGFMCGPGTPLNALLEYVDVDHLDRTPFSVSVPTEVKLTSGVLPRLDRCSQVWCPPLVSVPLDVRRSKVGVVCADIHAEPVDWFLDAARDYFSTQPNGLV